MKNDILSAMGIQLKLGDCLEHLLTMADNSVDSIVTDPPYGLKFMGKKWDYDVPGVDVWTECLRVLKPGGHLLAFAGTRTQHRMAVNIEDAGFEIRDMIAWVYGSGFPKSLDVSKAIDKSAGAECEFTRPGKVRRDGYGGDWDTGSSSSRPRFDDPATEAARQWQGWGTALKPALEPITVARKPLVGTVAANVLAHGTGAINVDGCRVESDGARPWCEARRNEASDEARNAYGQGLAGSMAVSDTTTGRWPANLIHDGSDDVLGAFPQAQGQQGRARTDGADQGNNTYGALKHITNQPEPRIESDKSAARFFYCAKASKSDRGTENNHPTVKPTDLMRYLCRLVTPPGGTVLDPFMGSGSTGKAAALEGFNFIGCELSTEYLAIAQARIFNAVETKHLR